MARRSLEKNISYLITLIICLLSIQQASSELDNDEDYLPPGVTTAEILKLRGFVAEQHYVTTSDGYVLSLVKGTNPLLRNSTIAARREPILFVHGVSSGGTLWIANSVSARPKDFTDIDVASSSLEQLIQQVGGDPSANAMPLLAMNFGYPIWILNRRGSLESLDKKTSGGSDRMLTARDSGLTNTASEILPEIGRNRGGSQANGGRRASSSSSSGNSLGLVSYKPLTYLVGVLTDFGSLAPLVGKSLDRNFWNYSFDEQAARDLPEVIDYVLNKSGRERLVLFSHSAGGAITLLALSSQPELTKKISRNILWAPAINLGHEDNEVNLGGRYSTLQNYIGPTLPPFLSTQRQAVEQALCNTEQTQSGACESYLDRNQGDSGGQEPVTLSVSAASYYPSSSHEYIQLGQWARSPRPTKFDYRTDKQNQLAYGQGRPPVYNLSEIPQSFMSFYAGGTDSEVSPADVRVTVSQLAVPYKLTVIDQTGVKFNHIGFYRHLNRSQLVNLPSLMDIARRVSF